EAMHSVAGQVIKVFCHSRARAHFESLTNGSTASLLGPVTFLHSVRDYRLVDPFDILLKVGPLRSRGWGSCPDSLITAPRFRKFIQIVWSGCGDEEGFGYDPVVSAHTIGSQGHRCGGLRWKRQTFLPKIEASVPAEVEIDDDDLAILHNLDKLGSTRK